MTIGRIAPTPHSGHAQLGMAAASPMHSDHRLIGGIVEINKHLLDQNSRESLPRPIISRRRVPCCRQVICKLHQCGSIDLRLLCRVGIQTSDALFELTAALECCVPASLELACDMPFRRINQVITSFGQRGLIPRFLKFAVHGLADIVGSAHSLVGRQDGSVHSAIRDGVQDSKSNRAIDAHTADADTKPCPDMAVIAW